MLDEDERYVQKVKGHRQKRKQQQQLHMYEVNTHRHRHIHLQIIYTRKFITQCGLKSNPAKCTT